MEKLANFWWVTLLRGIIAVILGALMLSSPALFTILVFVWFFGAYILLDGILSIIFSFTHPGKNRWWVFTGGILSIILAFMVFAWPGMTAVVLLYFIGFWALFMGIMEIIYAIAGWKAVKGMVWLLILGIISVIFGVYAIMNPVGGALAILWMIAVYLLIMGVLLIIFSIWLCSKRKEFAKLTAK